MEALREEGRVAEHEARERLPEAAVLLARAESDEPEAVRVRADEGRVMRWALQPVLWAERIAVVVGLVTTAVLIAEPMLGLLRPLELDLVLRTETAVDPAMLGIGAVVAAVVVGSAVAAGWVDLDLDY